MHLTAPGFFELALEQARFSVSVFFGFGLALILMTMAIYQKKIQLFQIFQIRVCFFKLLAEGFSGLKAIIEVQFLLSGTDVFSKQTSATFSTSFNFVV